MKILYVDYQMYGKDDIIEALQKLENMVEVTDIPLRYEGKKQELEQGLSRVLEGKGYDVVFTSNYYPEVSNVCKLFHIKYLSWTYDSPRIALYHPSILNECNYAFTFDSDECKRLRRKGVKNIYYMPLAVNPQRLAKVKITEQDCSIFGADVSLVASLYNEGHNLYDRMAPRLTDYTRGYLEAVMQAQKNLFGGFILEDVLKNDQIMGEMYTAMPYKLEQGSLTNREYVYANYFLGRKVAALQRLEYIEEISKRFEMKVYTPGDLSAIPTAKHMGVVDYWNDMNKVFRLSKINLNVTLPSIHTGIPLRAMDIMGAGGFLLTNYQADLFELFEPEVDFVYYTSLQEAIYKIDYYLQHEEERAAIAENGKKKMERCFTYENQLRQMLEISGCI